VRDDFLSGGDGDDFLFGDDGNDLLNGGTGNDAMFGGAGNDLYSIDNTGDRVIEALNGGLDTVESSIESYQLGDNVENLILKGNTALWGTGNRLNNQMVGNGENNAFVGGEGNDSLWGNAGDDELVGSSGDDLMLGGIVDTPLPKGEGILCS
jgi:Ca2+-binding RTX toxin-like protein